MIITQCITFANGASEAHRAAEETEKEFNAWIVAATNVYRDGLQIFVNTTSHGSTEYYDESPVGGRETFTHTITVFYKTKPADEEAEATA